MVIMPSSPEIEFNLTNSVKQINQSPKPSTEEIEKIKNLTLRHILLVRYAVNEVNDLDNSSLKAYFDGQIYDTKYEKQQMEQVLSKLNNLKQQDKKIITNMGLWCIFLSTPIGNFLLKEATSMGYLVNIPALFANILTNPEFGYGKTNLYWQDLNKIYGHFEQKNSTKKDMSRQ